MSPRRDAIACVAAALALLTVTPRAEACATCGCGDPTLTAMGTEKPFAGRVRGSLEARVRSDAIGEPRVDQLRLEEQRMDAQVAWAPIERVFLLVTAPMVRRQVESVSLARSETLGFGDVELRAKVFLFQDRDVAPRHLLSLLGGVKLPTGPVQRDAAGRVLPIELQAGTGSIDPLAGLAYAWFGRPWSVYASAVFTLPTSGVAGFRGSPSLRTTVAAQWQVAPWLSPRLAIDARVDGKAIEEGAVARDSGGFVGFVSPEVLVSPVPDLLLYASVRIPAAQALAGYHREGAVAGGGVAYDF